MEVVVEKQPPNPLTSIDATDPWWSAFSTAINNQ